MTEATHVAHEEPLEDTSTGLNNRKLLMWTFLASDVMFFGAFIATYLVYRNRSLEGPYPNQVMDIPVTSVSTFVLLMSSLTMVLALDGIRRNNKTIGRFWILATAALGSVFLGFQVFEFNEFVHLGLTPQTNLFGTTFFVLTGAARDTRYAGCDMAVINGPRVFAPRPKNGGASCLRLRASMRS